jgi:hypothetical protein
MGKHVYRRVRSIWNVARISSRMMIEDIATVWLLGIAPLLAHLAAVSPKQAISGFPPIYISSSW